MAPDRVEAITDEVVRIHTLALLDLVLDDGLRIYIITLAQHGTLVLVDMRSKWLLVLFMEVFEVGLVLEKLDYGLLDVSKGEKFFDTHPVLFLLLKVCLYSISL